MGTTEGGTPGAPSTIAADSVKVPANLLAVMSGLGASTSLVIFFVALLGVAVGGRPLPEGTEEAERVGYAFGRAFAVGVWLVGAGVGGGDSPRRHPDVQAAQLRVGHDGEHPVHHSLRLVLLHRGHSAGHLVACDTQEARSKSGLPLISSVRGAPRSTPT